MTSNNCCPVCALTQWAHNLYADGANPTTLICAFKEERSLPWQHVHGQDIVKAIQEAILAMHQHSCHYDLACIGSHSLRAGGMVAMSLDDYSAVQIQHAGCWTSTTFLDYIHGQMDATTTSIAQAMTCPIPFLNMATLKKLTKTSTLHSLLQTPCITTDTI